MNIGSITELNQPRYFVSGGAGGSSSNMAAGTVKQFVIVGAACLDF